MKTLAVIRREYLERVRAKSFLVGTILGPLLMSMFVWLPALLVSSHVGDQQTVGVIDPTGRYVESLRAALQGDAPAAAPPAAATREERRAREAAARAATRFTLLPISAEGRALGDAIEELKQKIRDESVQLGLVFDPEFADSRKVTLYSRSVSGFVTQDDLRPALNRVLREARFRAAGVPDTLRSFLTATTEWNSIAVTVEGEQQQKGDSAFLVAIVLIMFLYFMVLSYGAHTLTAVIEEKTNRVYEVLLSSVPAGQLMLGKVLGIGLAGLTQVGIWTAAFLVLAQQGVSLGSFTLDASMITPLVIASFLVFFLLGFFLYATMFAGVGAMCNQVQDSQQFSTPIMMGLILPMLLLTFVLRAPNAPVAVVLSLIPLFAPMLMFIRVCVQMPPLWQLLLSWALLVLSIWLAARAAGKLFRLGVLLTGASPTWATLLRALRQG